MKKIFSIIGARPQFIKHATVQLELQKYFIAKTIHTGQHYDDLMSKIFFEEFSIPLPEYSLNIANAKLQGKQTAIMITEIEKVLTAEKPHAVLVYGDTNSTLAATIVTTKMHIPLIHVEAGLRSFNRKMPEEINRIITDEFSNLLFCSTKEGVKNLKNEGISHNQIHVVGDAMYDTLKLVLPKLTKISIPNYCFVTLHRPYNTDNEERIKNILDVLNNCNKTIIFPLHPRTKGRLNDFGINLSNYHNIKFINPLGYIESISYQKNAECIITDSGGIQKEAYWLQKKCITLRSETEWVETLQNGWNYLLYEDLNELKNLMEKKPEAYIENLYGEGNAAYKIVKHLKKYFKIEV